MADRSTHPLIARYDEMWERSAPAVRAGRVTIDPFVLRKPDDGRRGVTLLARPTPGVADALVTLLDEFRTIEPDQYYQPSTDLHLTLLSLFTATVDHTPFLANVDAYRDAVAEAVDGVRPFSIEMIGVTVAANAVLAQGFPRDGTLDALRTRLRATLATRGFGDDLDRRYRLETAHVTLVRFAAPLRDPGAFVDALEKARSRDLGASRIVELELTLGDWYQSAERGLRLGTFALSGS